MAHTETTRSHTTKMIRRVCAVAWDRHYDRQRRRRIADLRQRELAEIEVVTAMAMQLEEIRALPEPSGRA